MKISLDKRRLTVLAEANGAAISRWRGLRFGGYAATCLLAISAAACSGSVSDAPSGGGAGTSDVAAGGQPGGDINAAGTGTGGTISVNPPDSDAPLDVNRVAIHRLNKTEYDNTMRDLLGVDSTPASGFIADETAYGFDNIAEAFGMTDARFEEYYNAADSLVESVFADPALTARIMVCTPSAASDTACMGQIINAFGLHAWRRPITDAEVTRLTQVATDAIALGEDPTGGVKQVVKTMLSSLPFLYRIEMDPNPNTLDPHPLDAYELASRLSYLTWSTMPDEALFGLAQNGTLLTNDTLSAQLDRMLADPKAQSFVTNFAGQWLGMRKLLTHAVDAPTYPSWTTTSAQAMSDEGLAYFNQFLAGPAVMTDFLTTPLPTDPANPADVRVGFMGLKAFLTVTSFPYRTAPTLRGKWVLENLLCQTIAQPPPNVPKLDPDNTPSADLQSENVRVRLEAHRADAACAVCHKVLDPIGIGLENYDAIGGYRTSYANGDAVDPSGVLPAQWNNQTFTSLQQLASILSVDTKLTDCASKELMTYALGRGTVTTDDPYLKQIRAAWATSGMGMKNLLKQIVLNDTFRFRRGETGVTQ